MKKAILALLLIAVALSGCITQSQGQPASSLEKPATQYQCADGTWVEDTSLCPPLSAEEQPSTGHEDCGSVVNTHLLTGEELTASEKIALNCFNEKMLGCSPSTLDLPGQGERTISVEGEEDDYCLMVFVDSEETKTCKLPKTFISDLDTLAGEDAPEIVVIGVSFAITAETFQNTLTGETINIECSS